MPCQPLKVLPAFAGAHETGAAVGVVDDNAQLPVGPTRTSTTWPEAASPIAIGASL